MADLRLPLNALDFAEDARGIRPLDEGEGGHVNKALLLAMLLAKQLDRAAADALNPEAFTSLGMLDVVANGEVLRDLKCERALLHAGEVRRLRLSDVAAIIITIAALGVVTRVSRGQQAASAGHLLQLVVQVQLRQNFLHTHACIA